MTEYKGRCIAEARDKSIVSINYNADIRHEGIIRYYTCPNCKKEIPDMKDDKELGYCIYCNTEIIWYG